MLEEEKRLPDGTQERLFALLAQLPPRPVPGDLADRTVAAYVARGRRMWIATLVPVAVLAALVAAAFIWTAAFDFDRVIVLGAAFVSKVVVVGAALLTVACHLDDAWGGIPVVPMACLLISAGLFAAVSKKADQLK